MPRTCCSQLPSKAPSSITLVVRSISVARYSHDNRRRSATAKRYLARSTQSARRVDQLWLKSTKASRDVGRIPDDEKEEVREPTRSDRDL